MKKGTKSEIGCWLVPVVISCVILLIHIAIRKFWVIPLNLCSGPSTDCQNPSNIAAIAEVFRGLSSLVFFALPPLYLTALFVRISGVAIKKFASHIKSKKLP
jgi:hypothetical protein